MKKRFVLPCLALFALCCVVAAPARLIYGSGTQKSTQESTKKSTQKESASDASEDTGDFQVRGGAYGEDYSYEDGVLTVLSSVQLRLSGRVREGGIVVAEGVSARLVLDGLTVSSSECALDIRGEEAQIELEGKNTLTSGSGYPGIRVPEEASLSVEGERDASLTVRGGTEAAGIGTAKREDFGSILLSGGNILANGGRQGTGIGAGSGGGGGRIEITGGSVAAKGGTDAADMGNQEQAASKAEVILDGNAILEAEEITGRLELSQGILNQGKEWNVYGDTTLVRDLSLAAGSSLIIGEEESLQVPQDLVIDSRGSIVVYGTLDLLGELNNERGSIYLYESGRIRNEENITGGELVNIEEGEILLSFGEVVIGEDGYRQNGIRHESSGSYTLRGSEESDSTITVEDEANVILLLEDAAIRAAEGEPALTVGKDAQVTMILSGDNHLSAERYEDALDMQDGASLEIRGSGSLTLEGREPQVSLRLEGGETADEETEALDGGDGTEDGAAEMTLDSGDRIETEQLPEEALQDGGLLAVTLRPGTQEARELTVSRQALQELEEAGASFCLETDYLSFEMDAEALNALLNAVDGDVRLRIAPFALTGQDFETARAVIGDGPVYDIQVSEVTGGRAEARNVEFGNGRVRLEIPYDYAAGQEGQVCLVYVGTQNLLSWMEDTVYDAQAKTAEAVVPHFSVYGVAVLTKERAQ